MSSVRTSLGVSDEPIWRLAYRSLATFDDAGGQATDALVFDIVAVSDQNNRRAGLTGALVHDRGAFLQVLEGPVQAIEATFDRLASDLRHRSIQVIEYRRVEARMFPEWGMVLAKSLSEQRARIAAIGCSTDGPGEGAAALVTRLRGMLELRGTGVAA